MDAVKDLIPPARAEGFRHMDRLVEGWESGKHRFNQAGECLLGVWSDGRCVGVGGLTRQTATTGRIRRVYVRSEFRRRGVGRALMIHLVQCASEAFDQVVLKTDTQAASSFYEALGFLPLPPGNEFDATHCLVFDAIKVLS